MKTLLVIIFVVISFISNCQIKIISPTSFDSVKTHNRVYYIDDNTHEYYGCGRNLEGQPINILFKRIGYDIAKKELHLAGYVYIEFDRARKDTIGFSSIEIFTGQPFGEILKNKKVILDSKTQHIRSKWNPKNGFFEVVFHLTKKDILYFNYGEPYCMQEFRISKLRL